MLCTKATTRAIERMDNINKIQTDTDKSGLAIMKMCGEEINGLKDRIVKLEDLKNIEYSSPQIKNSWRINGQTLIW